MTDSSDIAAKAREALTDPNNLDLALNPEPLVRSLLAALETAETERDNLAETLMHTEDSRALFKGLFDDTAVERNAARDTIVAVERALSNHPECDTYSPDDVVSCGWKRAVVDVRAALGGVS